MDTTIKSITIEKNIPIPMFEYGARGSLQSTFKKMKVGDSFIYPRRRQNSLGTSARSAGIKVSSRKINEEEIRVWRVA